MQFPIKIEPVANGGYRARCAAPRDLLADGAARWVRYIDGRR
jgi:hypothetical protein